MWSLPHYHQQLEECPQADHTPATFTLMLPLKTIANREYPVSLSDVLQNKLSIVSFTTTQSQ